MEFEMSSPGKTLSKTEREMHRRQKDAQELDKLVRDSATVLRSSFETGEDCAAECDHRRADLLADLDYRRLPQEIWRGKPGAEVLVAAMADLIAENERHLLATEQLWRRFDDLSWATTWPDPLGPNVVSDDLIRRRHFSDPPA
jgi:hypothetical protein